MTAGISAIHSFCQGSTGSMLKRFIDTVREHIDGEIHLAEPLRKHTSFKVGGDAEALISPRDSNSAVWLYRFARHQGIPLTVLGAGSNVIVSDTGIEGIVMKLKGPSAGIRFIGNGRVKAGAGVLLMDLAKASAVEGLSGLEPIAGIPGTVGGAVVMNAGTDECEISDLLRHVEVLTSSGRRRVFQRNELSFHYRHSIFRESDWLILTAEFKLHADDPAKILGDIDSYVREREERLPYDVPSAGCVFKRPPGDYAGRLIEESGCKGMRIGGAVVSDRHANFIVNVGGATAADIIELITRVRKSVFERTGVYLELEQIPLGATIS